MASGYLRRFDASRRSREAIASSGDRSNISRAILAIAQCLAHHRDLNPKIGFLNHPAWPRTRHKLFFRYQSARLFQQRDQDFQRSVADRNWPAILEQEMAFGTDDKVPERNLSMIRVIRCVRLHPGLPSAARNRCKESHHGTHSLLCRRVLRSSKSHRLFELECSEVKMTASGGGGVIEIDTLRQSWLLCTKFFSKL